MKLTVENISQWKELLDREAEDRLDTPNFSETESDEEWLFSWAGFTPEDVINEEISYVHR